MFDWVVNRSSMVSEYRENCLVIEVSVTLFIYTFVTSILIGRREKICDYEKPFIPSRIKMTSYHG